MKTDKEAAEDLTKDFLKNYPIPYDEQITIEYPVIYDGLIDMFLAGCKHKEESRYTFDEIKEALRIGVNIGMQNVDAPQYECDYNFDREKAIKESKDYIETIRKPLPTPPQTNK